MPIIEMGIVYRFYADGDDHAEEQFVDLVEGVSVREAINVVHTIQE